MHVERLQSSDKRVERALKATQLSQQPTTTWAQGQLMPEYSFSLRKALPTGPKNISGHKRRQTHPPGAPSSRFCTFPTGFQPHYPKSLRAPAALPSHRPGPSDTGAGGETSRSDRSEPLLRPHGAEGGPSRPGAPGERPAGSHHGTDGGESPHRHQRLHPPPAAAILGRD